MSVSGRKRVENTETRKLVRYLLLCQKDSKLNKKQRSEKVSRQIKIHFKTVQMIANGTHDDKVGEKLRKRIEEAVLEQIDLKPAPTRKRVSTEFYNEEDYELVKQVPMHARRQALLSTAKQYAHRYQRPVDYNEIHDKGSETNL